eukprot:scaffold2739_cov257-Pinguiococcus_pyrenoidosus.AAC.4
MPQRCKSSWTARSSSCTSPRQKASRRRWRKRGPSWLSFHAASRARHFTALSSDTSVSMSPLSAACHSVAAGLPKERCALSEVLVSRGADHSYSPRKIQTRCHQQNGGKTAESVAFRNGIPEFADDENKTVPSTISDAMIGQFLHSKLFCTQSRSVSSKVNGDETPPFVFIFLFDAPIWEASARASPNPSSSFLHDDLGYTQALRESGELQVRILALRLGQKRHS